MTGLYTPESGHIQLNGTSVTSENRQWLRSQFSTVFSDFYLFDDLGELVSQENGTHKQAESHLQALQLNNKLTVSETGEFSTTKLSQGQRKRLALLAAFCEERSLYLFDEWAADQDPEFKDVFYRSILPTLKSRGKTVIVISHDDRYFDAADRIFKLDEGSMRELKNFEEMNAL